MSGASTAPPAAPAALLYATVRSLCAAWATASPACKAPVTVAGGPNPVIALPGHTPTSPLTLVAVPATFVTVDPARIPNVHAEFNPEEGAGGMGAHGAE